MLEIMNHHIIRSAPPDRGTAAPRRTRRLGWPPFGNLRQVPGAAGSALDASGAVA
jgi:hypothetical protein